MVGPGVIATGWDSELDEQRKLARGGKELLAGIEATERGRTGISTLKIKYNRVFGYFLEISKSHLDRVPENYERRQTLTNAERYVTPELKELESKILTAEEISNARERELYSELLDALSGHARRIAETAGVIAQIDVLSAFADRARRWNYCRPVIEEETGIFISEGRHPVLEAGPTRPPVHPQRHRPRPGPEPYRPAHRSQHGRQINLSQTDGAHHLDGSLRVVRTRGRGSDRSHRPDLHPGRGLRHARPRRIDVHGRDDRNRQHPQPRHAKVTGDPR